MRTYEDSVSVIRCPTRSGVVDEIAVERGGCGGCSGRVEPCGGLAVRLLGSRGRKLWLVAVGGLWLAASSRGIVVSW